LGKIRAVYSITRIADNQWHNVVITMKKDELIIQIQVVPLEYEIYNDNVNE